MEVEHLNLLKGESDAPLAVINGRGRTGKTSLGLRIIDQYQGRVIFFDGKREIVLEGGEYIDREPESLAAFVVTNRAEERWRISYWPGRDLHEEIERLSVFLMELGNVAQTEGKKWPLLLVLDEFAVLKGQGVYVSEAFAELSRIRGKWGFSLLLISHRPRDIPPAYLFDVTHWYTFRQRRPDDLKYIFEFTEADNVDRIRELRRFEYGAWADRPGAVNFKFFDKRDCPIENNSKK